jgi:hypothetical protein
MLNVAILSVVMQSVVMLSVVAPIKDNHSNFRFSPMRDFSEKSKSKKVFKKIEILKKKIESSDPNQRQYSPHFIFFVNYEWAQ